jgi:CheY-like chemotaxis protein
MTKILVADDDQAIREMLQMMLETFNYEVFTASDGKEALKAIQTSQDRLIVMLDLVMPRLDGREVLRIIAADTTLSTRHVYILLSAHHNPCLLEFDNAAFQVKRLTKPFAMDDLLNVVDEAARKIRTPLPIVNHCK